MASHAVSDQQAVSDPHGASDEQGAYGERESRQADDRLPARQPSGYVVPEGRLNVSEFLLSMAGAASPFGEDSLPLPVSELTYIHPTEDADPQHL